MVGFQVLAKRIANLGRACAHATGSRAKVDDRLADDVAPELGQIGFLLAVLGRAARFQVLQDNRIGSGRNLERSEK